MSLKTPLWIVPVIVALVGQLGLGLATSSFDQEMDEDIAALEQRLKESGLDTKQAETVDRAFRSTHYNVRNFVKDVCNWLIATITAVAVVAAVACGIGVGVRGGAGQTSSSGDGQSA